MENQIFYDDFQNHWQKLNECDATNKIDMISKSHDGPTTLLHHANDDPASTTSPSHG